MTDDGFKTSAQIGELPFVLQNMRPRASRASSPNATSSTSEDPLAATVEVNKFGLVLSRDTSFTRVQRETTDDN